MSENRLVAILKSSWKILLPAGLILGAGFVGKVYFTQQNIPKEKTQGAGVDAVLADAVDKLSALVDTYDGNGNPFPAAAGWTPAAVSCGEDAPVVASDWEHPTWVLLGIAPDAPTPFQYRFRASKEDGFELMARTDRDCDGLFQVRTRRGRAVWTGGLDTGILTTDNPGE